MDNPETLSIFGAQDSGCRRTKHQQQQIKHRKLSGRAITDPTFENMHTGNYGFCYGAFHTV
jgi:hypothetical protein